MIRVKLMPLKIRTNLQGAAKGRGHRKNKITFTPGNGFKPKFQNY